MENKVEKDFVSQTVNKVSIYGTFDEVNFALCSGNAIASQSYDYIPLLFIIPSFTDNKQPVLVVDLYNTKETVLRNIRHFLVKYASVFSFFGYRYSRLHS
jgi:hypothetical protein